MMGALSASEMETLLTQERFGHLACCDDGKPFVFPMAFAYHAGVLYGQTTVGRKIDILRRNPNVCFQVQRVDDASWRSVQCWGTFEELDFDKLEGEEAARIVQLLSDHLGSIQRQVGIEIRFTQGNKPSPVTINGKVTTLFRIVVHETSGVFRKDWND